MKRPYLVYLIAVVLPSAATITGGILLAGDAWDEVRRASEERVAGWVATALVEERGALATGRAAGYRAAVYRDGVRVEATQPAPGPDRLDDDTRGALRAGSAEIVWEGGSGRVVPVPVPDGPGEVAVLLAASTPPPPPLPVPLLLVMGLLLVFAGLAGWILLAGGSTAPGRRAVLLVSLVPALTAWGFLVHGDRLFHEAAQTLARRDLTRALSVARMRGVAGDPSAFLALTGFHAYRVRDRTVEAASGDGRAEAVAALPAPPPSFTSAGTVRTPEGVVPYVALRLPSGGFTVATAPPAGAVPGGYRRVSWILAGALAGWLLLLGAGLSLMGRRDRSD